MDLTLKVRPMWGLGNRLIAIASALRLQELGVFKHVSIQWEPHQHLEAEFAEVLNIKDVTVTTHKQSDVVYPNNGKIPVFDNITVPAAAVFTTEDDRTDRRTTNSQLVQAFKRVRFRPWFYDTADRWDVKDRTGLHCRRTDFTFGGNPSVDRNYVSRYHDFLDKEFVNDIKELYTGPYFIASDSQQTSEYVTNQLNDVFYTPKQHYPVWCTRSLDTVTEGIIDLILLSRCSKVIADSISTFSVAAALIGNIEKITWTRPPLW